MRLLLLFGFAALCRSLWDRWKKILKKWRAARTRPAKWPQGDVEREEPDVPQPFGYKSGWLCVRSNDPVQVMSRLGCKHQERATWKLGLEKAGREQMVFVSPCLDGFILVIGLLGLEKEQLDCFASGFEELQYFGSHRVVDYCGWARYQAGHLVRGYAYLGERGEVLWDEGPLTAEEVALGAEEFPRAGKEIDWEYAGFPTEETVLDLAAAWGVNVRFTRRQYLPAYGFLCSLSL